MPTTHTPGPWYTMGAGIYIGSPETDDIAHIATAHCYGVPGDPVANARLIAAAPELLAALKVMTLTPGILAHLEAHDPMALKQARAAIARATGQ